ncbi:MAG: tetratricopeptide repeat protein [Verrucomicrobiales bacterium]|nr:tetratricopeptide repeat protein [Verrucomicrobiales bacterium]
MKPRFLIIIIIAVAAIHLMLFVLTQKRADEDLESSAASETPVKHEEIRPIEPMASSPPPAPEETLPESSGTESAVSDAVNLIQKKQAPVNDPLVEEPPESTSPRASETGATMIVGRVEGQSKLPPELFPVAEEGAKAVAAQDWEKAREIYLRLVDEAPGNALGYANLGVAEHQLGNLLAASGNLRKSLEINPSIAQNWQTLGIIHYERDELELAISCLTRAIHEDPSDARTHLYLAAVIRTYGWIEASITELERAVETDPQFADAHYNLALTYLETKPPRLELARRHYYSAIDLGAVPSPELESIFQPDE